MGIQKLVIYLTTTVRKLMKAVSISSQKVDGGSRTHFEQCSCGKAGKSNVNVNVR